MSLSLIGLEMPWINNLQIQMTYWKNFFIYFFLRMLSIKNLILSRFHLLVFILFTSAISGEISSPIDFIFL